MEAISEIRDQLQRIEERILGQKAVLTFDEVVKYTGLSKSYLYKLTSKGLIPHFKPSGKIVYFDRVEIEQWLKQNPVKTKAQIEQEAVNAVVLGRKGGKQ